MSLGQTEDIKNVQRAVEGIVGISSQGVFTYSLPNNTVRVFIINTQNSAAPTTVRILSQVEMSFFVDSVSVATQLPASDLAPTTQNFDMSQWQFIGPWNDWLNSDFNGTITLVFIKNLTGSDHTIIQVAKSRAISNTITNLVNP